MPQQLLRSGLTDTRDGLAAGRVRSADAFVIAGVKRSAAREGLALPARTLTTSHINATCTNATTTCISDTYTQLEQTAHALRQSAIAIRDAADDAMAALLTRIPKDAYWAARARPICVATSDAMWS